MRRAIAGAAAAVLLLIAVAACTRTPPAGTDGDLFDGWAAMPPPAPFRPVAGECHEALTDTAAMAGHRPVDCADLHVAETFHVGTAADGPVPPAPGSAPMRTAYAECAAAADGFLGGSWRAASIQVRAVVPARHTWAAGARWFRCDVAQADLDGAGGTSRTGSLRNALAKPGPLRLGCFRATVAGGDVRAMSPVSCREPHAAEFAGLWTAPDVAYAEQSADRTRSAAGCRGAIARYTGVPDDADTPFRTGWIAYHPTRTEWQQGERRVRCFLWFSGRTVTRSLAGAGPSALPVR